MMRRDFGLLLFVCFVSVNGWLSEDSDLLSALNARLKESEQLANEQLAAHGGGGSEADEYYDDDDDKAIGSSTKLEGHAADLFSSLIDGSGLNFPNLFSLMKQVRKPWWEGENVCKYTDEKVQKHEQENSNQTSNVNPFLFFGSASFSSCRNEVNKYVCVKSVHSRQETKTTEVTYKCCPGSRRNLESDTCEKVEVKSLAETAKRLGSSEFVQAATNMVKDRILDAANMTVFVPSDEAVETFRAEMGKNSKSYQNGIVFHLRKSSVKDSEGDEGLNNNEIPQKPQDNSENPITTTSQPAILNKETVSSERILAHFVPGVHDVHDVDDEQILKTVDGLPIRINNYPGKRGPVTMANCAVVKSANHPVENGGLVHVTDAFLPQATKTAKEILEGDETFSTFAGLLRDAGLLDSLGEAGNYTIFAPTNEAMSKIDPVKMRHMQRGKSCIETVLKSHVVPRTLCSQAIGELKVMTRASSGSWIMIDKTDDDQFLIGKNAKTSLLDVVVTNGVMHVLDYPIIPTYAMPPTALMEERNHTTWLKLLEKAGLTDAMDSGSNRTLFVPSEEALKTANLDALDADKLKEVLLLHTSDESVCSCQMRNNLIIHTQAGEKGDLRVTTYDSGAVFAGWEPKILIQCATILRRDERACDSHVHEVDRVLQPSTKTILEILQEPEYGTLKQIMTGTSVEEELKNGNLSSVTLLAPTESAFANLTAEELAKLKSDKVEADRVLRRHIIEDVVCCNSIGMSLWPFGEEVATATGAALGVRRKNRDEIIFGNAVVQKCDLLAKDGLIHQVDKVMIPKPISLKGSEVNFIDPKGSSILLYGL